MKMTDLAQDQSGNAPVVPTHRAGLPMRYLWSILPALLLTLSGLAQDDPGPCDPPGDKKVVKLLEDAGKARDANARHQKLKAALEADPECAECLLRLGLSAFRIASDGGGNFEPAQRYLEQLDARCPNYHSDVYYHLAVVRNAAGDHAAAIDAIEAFQRFPLDDPQRRSKHYDRQNDELERMLPELRFFRDFFSSTTPFEPRPVPRVNTAADEYLPMLSPDNELLFFTRLRKERAKGDIVSRDVEEFMEARRSSVKEDFDQGRALPEPFNVGDNYGGVTINVNNKEMFVTVCAPPDARGYRNCDIFRTHYDSKFDLDVGGQSWEWTGLEELGAELNTPDGWESQPTLSGDGRTLYFATVRPGSQGTDIFQSTRDDSGNWGPASPVKGINTPGDEKAPFMHSDSRTLYFAARRNADGEGHRGAGGYDIFFSRLQDDGSWSTPRNLGHPYNTDQDEHGLIVSADGRTAYFASNRFKGLGGLDILGFELPKEARPEDVLVVKGDVRDEQGAVVRDATVEIKYLDTRHTEVVKVDNADGRYATVVRLRPGSDVVLTVKKEGHVFDSRSYSAEDTVRAGVAEVDMTVQKIAVGRSYQVNDIKYATNSAAITPSSEYILDELITFLTENPTVRIRIEGHTDNVGRLEDNMALSNDRAFTVMEYLQGKGIQAGRLSFKGMGPTKPVASNDTAEGRARNRRTEFVIVAK